MREQQVFFEQHIGGKRIVVIKTYDTAFAREAFDQMSPLALDALAASLDLDTKFEPADIPSPSDEAFPDFLWEAVEEGAREDWDSFSYFIVREDAPGKRDAVFVSSHSSNAEAYAKGIHAVSA